LNDPALMRRLQQEVPDRSCRRMGRRAVRHVHVLAGGDFVVVHMRAAASADRLARMTGLEAMSRQTGKFVVDNEPIGAARGLEPSRRDDNPAAFFAQGALARVLGIDPRSTARTASMPSPRGVQQQAAVAFIAGATIAPDDVMLTFVPAEDAGAPVRETRTQGARPRVRGRRGSRAWSSRRTRWFEGVVAARVASRAPRRDETRRRGLDGREVTCSHLSA
jgi:hypothetical protein